jgi:hypothetical protein
MLGTNIMDNIFEDIDLKMEKYVFALSSRVLQTGEIRYIKELFFSDIERFVVPLAIPKECDNWDNGGIVAQIEQNKDYIYLVRLGTAINIETDTYKENQYGILYTNSYSDNDWELYGDNIAMCDADSLDYRSWVEKNYQEELYRRFKNYKEKRLLQGESVKWYKETEFRYDKCLLRSKLKRYWIQDTITFFKEYNLDISESNIIELLGQLDLKNYEEIKKHKLTYHEILPDILIGQLVLEPLIYYMRNTGDKDNIALYCAFIDLLYEKGNERMKNIVDVTILETIIDDTEIYGIFKKSIGTKLLSHIRKYRE